MKRLELPARQEALRELAAAVRQECEGHGVVSEDILSIELICDELASNICRHAYGDGPGRFEFSIDFDGECCMLEFVDWGTPFNPTERASPDTTAAVEERQIGGLGILFVARQADGFEYERRGDKNVVTVCKKLQPGANPA